MDTEVKSFDYLGFHVAIHIDNDPPNPLEDSGVEIKVYAPLSRYNIGNTKQDAEPGTKVAIPFYAYIHGSIAVSLNPYSDPWDSGRAGTIYIDDEVLDRDFNGDLGLGKDAVLAWFNEYKAWVEGDVFGYVITDPKDSSSHSSEDSCWGFYGVTDCAESAKDAIRDNVWAREKALKCASDTAKELACEYLEIARHV